MECCSEEESSTRKTEKLVVFRTTIKITVNALIAETEKIEGRERQRQRERQRTFRRSIQLCGKQNDIMKFTYAIRHVHVICLLALAGRQVRSKLVITAMEVLSASLTILYRSKPV